MGERTAKKVLLIGWDAADWKIINPLMDRGEMPALEKLVNNGVMGNLATLEPPLSPMLWTSIATGKRADKHGVLGFTEPNKKTGGVSPVLSTSRKVKAIWNILTQHNLKTHVIGWWPGHPAEPINGISISNFYQRAKAPIDKPWPMMTGTVHPEKMNKLFASLRIHPDELTEAHILPFIPKVWEIDQEKDKRIGMLSKIISDCSSIHAAATFVMESEEWDFMAIYYDAIDHFCHGFMKFHPPQLKGIPDDLFDKYKGIVTAGYKFHDMMLERLINLAGTDTTIILVSDHGFHSNHLRPISLPKIPAAPALEHSPYGIICMRGNNIKKDERIYGASLLDITPTILTLFGLPVAEDMDGHPLINVFDKEIKQETINSWEDIVGECGMHTVLTNEGHEINQDTLNQLVELGYIEKPDNNKEKAYNQAVRENNYNLAKVYIDSKKYNEAIPLLEDLYNDYKDDRRFALRLAQCYQSVNRVIDCRQIIKNIREGEKETNENPYLDILEGTVFLGENKPKKALDLFRKAEKTSKNWHHLHIQIGRSFLLLKRWKEAEKSFRKALVIDPDNEVAHHSLGVSLLRQNMLEPALNELLSAIGLRYYFPFAHFHLGEVLTALNKYERAVEAYEVCLSMMPNINKARIKLIDIYENHHGLPEKAKIHKDVLSNIKKDIIIVSGLPRSGTSMMMQMLKNGGVDIYTDSKRKADKNNTKGYFEHDNVKQLARNKSWLKEAEGKAVKIISFLLTHLPAKYRYKIIFMERDLKEVISSQQKMLKKPSKDTYPLGLEISYKNNLEQVKKWNKKHPNADIIFVKYKNAISSPKEEAKRVKDFLNREIDIDNMIKAVEPMLCHSNNK